MENGERRKGREESIFAKSCACIVRISIEARQLLEYISRKIFLLLVKK